MEKEYKGFWMTEQRTEFSQMVKNEKQVCQQHISSVSKDKLFLFGDEELGSSETLQNLLVLLGLCFRNYMHSMFTDESIESFLQAINW